MDFSKLNQSDRMVLVAGVVVAITGIISLSNDWGILMAVSMLAGLAAIGVVLQPQLAPAMKLPATKGLSILALGAVATIVSGLTALDWFGWILEHIASFDALQFMVGLIAAIVILYAGWMLYQAERKTAAPTAPTGA